MADPSLNKYWQAYLPDCTHYPVRDHQCPAAQALPDKVLDRLHTTLGEYELYHSDHMQPRQVRMHTIRAWVSCINFTLLVVTAQSERPLPSSSISMQYQK
jgi:hypothetical protein